MKRAGLLVTLIAMMMVAGCGATAVPPEPSASLAPAAADAVATEASEEASSGGGMGHGMGRSSGMHERHHATVPAPYAGLTNPVPADEDSLARGAEDYGLLCASCHGDGGMGDGPAAASLDPAPSAVAHSSQMLGDDMLFWRISEGGAMAPFGSSMPAWKGSLDEEARWDLVNYVRALGSGEVAPRRSAGGEAYDPAREQAERAEMLAAGVEQGVITQEEADLFARVHGAMDELVGAGGRPSVGGMGEMRTALLAALVDAGTITQEEADAFEDIHGRLEDAGLMG